MQALLALCVCAGLVQQAGAVAAGAALFYLYMRGVRHDVTY